jgi:hypothetical protein
MLQRTYRLQLQGQISKARSSIKTGSKPSNQLAANFGSYRKQEKDGRVGLSSNWLTTRQNETTELLYGHQARQKETRTGVYEGLKTNISAGLGKTALTTTAIVTAVTTPYSLAVNELKLTFLEF